MRFNPLSLEEREGHNNFVISRIHRACESSAFVSTFWQWQPLSINLGLYLTVRERAILSTWCAVLLLDAPTVAFGITEHLESISVSSYEVPTPRVAISLHPRKTCGTSDSVGQQGGFQILLQCRGVQTQEHLCFSALRGVKPLKQKANRDVVICQMLGKLSKVMSGGMWNIPKMPFQTMAKSFRLRNF